MYYILYFFKIKNIQSKMIKLSLIPSLCIFLIFITAPFKLIIVVTLVNKTVSFASFQHHCIGFTVPQILILIRVFTHVSSSHFPLAITCFNGLPGIIHKPSTFHVQTNFLSSRSTGPIP